MVNPDGVKYAAITDKSLCGIYSIVCTTCVVVRMVGLWWSSLFVTPGRSDSRTLWSFRSAQWVTSLLSSPAEYPNNIFKSHTNLYTNLFPCTWKKILKYILKWNLSKGNSFFFIYKFYYIFTHNLQVSLSRIIVVLVSLSHWIIHW